MVVASISILAFLESDLCDNSFRVSIEHIEKSLVDAKLISQLIIAQFQFSCIKSCTSLTHKVFC